VWGGHSCPLPLSLPCFHDDSYRIGPPRTTHLQDQNQMRRQECPPHTGKLTPHASLTFSCVADTVRKGAKFLCGCGLPTNAVASCSGARGGCLRCLGSGCWSKSSQRFGNLRTTRDTQNRKPVAIGAKFLTAKVAKKPAMDARIAGIRAPPKSTPHRGFSQYDCHGYG